MTARRTRAVILRSVRAEGSVPRRTRVLILSAEGREGSAAKKAKEIMRYPIRLAVIRILAGAMLGLREMASALVLRRSRLAGRGAVAALILFALVASSVAQVSAKKVLTLDGARRVIAAAEAEAKKNNATGVIAVVDDGGNLMAVERLDGTFAAGALISIGKARTAVLFKKPTRFFEDVIKNGRTAMVTVKDFTPLQGGIPIFVDGQVVGGVGVSGAASAQQDEELAIAGAAAVGGTK